MTTESVTALIASFTALVISITGLVLAVKTWWEMCEVHRKLLAEAKSEQAKKLQDESDKRANVQAQPQSREKPIGGNGEHEA